MYSYSAGWDFSLYFDFLRISSLSLDFVLWCICTVLIDCPILMLYLQSALHVIGFVELLLRTGCFQHRIGCREETSQLVLGLFAGVGVG